MLSPHRVGAGATIASIRSAGRGLRDPGGSTAVEFAIVGPVLVLILFGMISYGGYFWMSHALQQLTNDAARSALAGLTSTERSQLAQSTVTVEAPNYAFLDASKMKVNIGGDTQSMTVSLVYDASSTPFWSLDRLVPMPSSSIQRSATIKLGGY